MTSSDRRRSKRGSLDAAASPELLADLAALETRSTRIGAAAVGIAAFMVFLGTLAPDMQPGDGIELASAAHVLGVPHPTGYPFYMLMLKLFSMLPIAGEVIARTTIFSALCGAAVAAVSFLIGNRILAAIVPAWSPKARLVASGAFGLLAASLRFHWQNAVLTEVYSLQLLIMVLFVWSAITWFESGRSKWLILAGALIGIGLAHQRMSLFLGLPFAGMLFVARRRGQQWRAVWFAVGAALAGLLFYAYLPIRASANPPLNWGDPSTPSRFLTHVRGSEYLQFYFLRPAPGESFTSETYNLFVSRTIGQFLADFARQFAPFRERVVAEPLLRRQYATPDATSLLFVVSISVLAAAGAFAWIRARKTAALIALAIALQNVGILFLYNVLDISDYCLFPYWFWTLCGFVGLVWLIARSGESGRFSRVPAEASYALLLIPMLVIALNWRQCDRREHRLTEQYSYMILPKSEADMPSGSILLTGAGDLDTFACWYRQMVRQERRDVLVFAANFIAMPWYPRHFTREQIERYQLRFFTGVAQSAAEYSRRILDGVIDKNIGKFPIFTTISDPQVLKEFEKRYLVQEIATTAVQTTPWTPEKLSSLYRILPRKQ